MNPLKNEKSSPESLVTLRDYFCLANVTLSDKGEHLNRAHALTGFDTEKGEAKDALKRNVFYGQPLNLVNFAEELGDIAWYTHIAMIEVLSKNLTQVYPFSSNSLVENLDTPLETFALSCVKEFLFSVTELELEDFAATEVDELMSESGYDLVGALDEIGDIISDTEMGLAAKSELVFKQIAVMSFALNISLKDILRGNIAKLLKRYPKEKFDVLDSSLRDLAGEANKVEAAVRDWLPLAADGQGKRYKVEFDYHAL
jgi:hypothetical protein